MSPTTVLMTWRASTSQHERKSSDMNITPIIEAVFALIAAIVTAVVVPYIKSRTTAAQQTEIAAWVRIAVTAAEQIYTGTGRGKEKKKYVEDWLKAHGVTVDSEKLDALIESAVYELKNGFLTIEGGLPGTT